MQKPGDPPESGERRELEPNLGLVDASWQTKEGSMKWNVSAVAMSAVLQKVCSPPS